MLEQDSVQETPEGYRTLKNAALAEQHLGPFYYKKTEDSLLLGFHAGEHHGNTIGTVHGGVLLFFADYAVIMIAMKGQKESCATISCNCDFISGAKRGDWIEAEGTITRRTGSLVFVTGRIFTGEKTLLTFQSVVKRIHVK
ncbi:MAG: hypothetical protein ACI92E_002042 [Oceanicoccus sp.]|jgi:uncharacterized protein (TIGR00369 family)